MADRVTQEAVEVVAVMTPTARVTQEAVEVVAVMTPTARVTQVVVEVLDGPPPGGARRNRGGATWTGS